MSKIRVLSEHISNRIAAGEVIERPASVVKELVENSIDSGAGSIIVEIQKAGRKLIAVTDNGCGMDQDDAMMCLEPHATSKIKSATDIDRILTLGFRGEAIPSIASISRFSLTTRQHESLEGFEVNVRGGKMVLAEPAGCAPGTRIEVRDLFFNVPARKKFMRADATEERHIQEMMYMLSLPYPGVAFELVIDGRKVFASPAHDNLMPRIKTFFGKSYADSMLRVNFADEGVEVSGYVARHGFTRSTRREQRTFFNGRPVEALAAYRGIREGFGGLLEKGRFPPCLLFIKLDPLTIDINVHPAKREVRLKNEYKVSGVITEAVRRALRQAPAPSVTLDSKIPLKSLLNGAQIKYERPKAEQADLDLEVSVTPAKNFAAVPEIQNSREQEQEVIISHEPEHTQIPHEVPVVENEAVNEEKIDCFETVETTIDKEEVVSENPDSKLRLPGSGVVEIVGFLDNTYIIGVTCDGMIIIDQHAAHERVMFERLLNAAKQGVASQRLLLPIALELSRAEAAYIGKFSEKFLKLGFEVDALSSNTVMLNAIPASLSQENAGGLLRDMLSHCLMKVKLRINLILRLWRWLPVKLR